MGRHADTIFVHAAVWGIRGVDACAVRDGLVVAHGHDAIDLRGARTTVVDLAGGTLLPGFRDGHMHPLDGGVEALACDLVDAADVAEVVRRVTAYDREHPGDGWLLGYGYPPELLPGGVGRASTIDAAVADRPVALWSSDHHMVWCNTAALRVAGITEATDDPPRGTVVRDADGVPVGTLLEEAEALLDPHLPRRGTEQLARGFTEGLRRMAAAGIVWAQDAWTTPDRLEGYQRVADEGRLTADVDLACKVEVDRWEEQVGAFVEAREEAARREAARRRDGVPGGSLTSRTVKFFVDGVIEGGTAALLEPYCALDDGAGHGHDHGILNWTADDLATAATAMDAAGFRLHLHAIGDAGVRTALDALEEVGRRNGPGDRRPVVAHTHLVHPDDLPRFARLGVVANFEPLWAQPNEIMLELTEPRLGPVRSTWQYPIGSLLRSGAHVSFGSDWPVSSHEPLRGIAVAVTRQTSGGDPPGGWLPDERVSLAQAVAAYTTGTAHQAHDTGAGTLAVGQRADLVALGAPPTALEGRDLADVPVTGTWLRGEPVLPDRLTESRREP